MPDALVNPQAATLQPKQGQVAGYQDSQNGLILAIEGLSFRWQKDAPLVLAISELKVAKASKVFIRGPSGSGKTTLLNLIAGVLEAEAGTITINHTLISKLSSRQKDRFRADHIGFIFQMFNLIPYLTVLENITLPLKFSSKRQQRLSHKPESEAKRLMERLGLSAELCKRKVTDLSIGQQQRVAAARALIGKPPLVIADEPTSALDEENRELFLNLLFEECSAASMSLLFVSHDARLEHLFDYTLRLEALSQISSTP